jgi:predicted site-specific integrase-resolvase
VSGVNLSEWAERVGVSKFTAYRWFREGTLPVPATRAGRLILVDLDGPPGAGRTVVYARVSSHDQRADLDRQVAAMTQWATAQALSVDEVVVEVGSGMNGKRPKLDRLLADATATTVVVLLVRGPCLASRPTGRNCKLRGRQRRLGGHGRSGRVWRDGRLVDLATGRPGDVHG